MQHTKAAYRFIFRLLLVFALFFGITVCYLNNAFYTLLLFLTLTFVVILETVSYTKKYFATYHKIVTSLLYDDFSLNLNGMQINSDSNLNKLYYKIKNEHYKNRSKEVLYQQLLNSISSGFLIVKQTKETRKIMFMNQHFCELFQIPQASSWSYLQRFMPQFCAVLENKNFQELKTTIEIEIESGERQTYVIQNSKTFIANESHDVIFLDSIQRVIDSTEKEAWINIMKVISHELINSLTPIYSLAHSTKMYFEEPDLSAEDYADIHLSLDTIMSRSKHLQTFVEQYRQLTMLPNPTKKDENILELLKGIKQSFLNELTENKITFTIAVSPEINVLIDRAQMEQVFINLIKNSIHSVANATIKKIEISGQLSQNRLQLVIHDSGALIDETIVPKIFLPFYTTRKDGAGIGLTLSKNIVEAHGGYLFFQQQNEEKKFVLVLQKKEG